MIARGRIQKNKEAEPAAYIAHGKRKKTRGGSSRKPSSQNTKKRNDRMTSHIKFFNFHKKGHYARVRPEKGKRPLYNTRGNYNNKRRKDNQINNHDKKI